MTAQAYPAHTRDGDVWEVFAKFKQDEPLHHVGTVIAPNPDMARIYAQKLYDEWTWSEMVAVPRDQILHLIEPE